MSFSRNICSEFLAMFCLLQVLELGIDGWKCDGTDPYILEVPGATGYDGKHISRKEYSEAYYGDFFDYTRERYGTDHLIMSRPVDG